MSFDLVNTEDFPLFVTGGDAERLPAIAAQRAGDE